MYMYMKICKCMYCDCVQVHHDNKNRMDFPKIARPRPETRLAGYKRKRAIDQTFPFQCSHYAASPNGSASPPRRRLRVGQWESFIFFARPARSAQLISGRRRTSIMISRSPIISIFSPKSSSRSPCCVVARSTLFPISGPSIRPYAFRRSDSLLWLQPVASIHALRSHDTSGP